MDYYNEFDPYAAAWLRNLIAAGHIPAGDVDERSIKDVQPTDLAGYTQCHFFAGIGGWPLALRLAGWPPGRPVWTGSCPCQPFSNAGARKGTADDRHLWPYWYELIRQCRPAVVFGEQVESAIAHGWLDLVQVDVEREGYAFAAAGIPAAGVGAPHGRHRLWFVADALPAGRPEWRTESGHGSVAGIGGACSLADDDDDGRHQQPVAGLRRAEVHDADGRGAGGVGNAERERREMALQPAVSGRTQAGVRQTDVVGSAGASGRSLGDTDDARPQGRGRVPERAGELAAGSTGLASFWSDCDWLPCTDGKARPVEPGTFPLAHGVSNRVGRLRAYGNAIVPQVAAAFIGAYLEA